MSSKKPLTQFCEITRPNSSIEKAEAISLHASALAALQGIDVSDHIKYRIEEAMDALLEAHIGICKTTGPDFNVVQSHIANETGFMQYFSRRDRAALNLSALLDQVENYKLRPDGYTPFELMEHADIKKGLWQSICKLASLEISRGDSHRRFSNSNIQKLILAARQHGKRKGNLAADAWEALLEHNRQTPTL